VPRPRGAHAAVKTSRGHGPTATGPASAELPGAARSSAKSRTSSKARLSSKASTVRPLSTVRSVAADIAAAMVVMTVVPLALLQLPDAIAWAVPGQFAAAGPGTVTSLLRVSGLALTAMVISVPLGALGVRRFRAWPVLVAGLGVFGLADILGNTARTIAQIGIDRSMHGFGAGIVLAAVTALATERRNRAGRALTAWWAVCVVTGLAAAPEVMRRRLASGDWHAALQPYPWLTGAALGLAALYALLSEGAVTRGTRANFPAAERSQLALLAAPVTGMCVVAVAGTYGHSQTVTAAAISEVISLAGITIMTARTGSAKWFAVACAVTGFTLAPAAGAVTDLMRAMAVSGSARDGLTVVGVQVGGPELCVLALCGAAGLGAVIAVVLPDSRARLVVATGLSLAAAGFAASYLAAGNLTAGGLTTGSLAAGGLPRSQSELLAVVCIPVAGGLAAALAAGLRATGAPGALCGVVLLLAGVLVGYLADGAIELHAVVDSSRSAAGVQGALTTADVRWNIAAAVLAAGTALIAFWRVPRRATCGVEPVAISREVEDMAGAPVREAGRTPDHE
jgi:hypothetical protein